MNGNKCYEYTLQCMFYMLTLLPSGGPFSIQTIIWPTHTNSLLVMSRWIIVCFSSYLVKSSQSEKTSNLKHLNKGHSGFVIIYYNLINSKTKYYMQMSNTIYIVLSIIPIQMLTTLVHIYQGSNYLFSFSLVKAAGKAAFNSKCITGPNA